MDGVIAAEWVCRVEDDGMAIGRAVVILNDGQAPHSMVRRVPLQAVPDPTGREGGCDRGTIFREAGLGVDVT